MPSVLRVQEPRKADEDEEALGALPAGSGSRCPVEGRPGRDVGLRATLREPGKTAQEALRALELVAQRAA
jgi:hypothetical protein